MPDRQSQTFEILLNSRERKAKQLDTLLAAQRKQRKELEEVEEAKRAEIAQQVEQQAERDAQLDVLMDGQTAVKAADFEAERQYRQVLGERCSKLETELSKLQQTVRKKDDEIHQIQHEIAKNKAQIESYQKLLAKWQNRVAKVKENEMEEEAAEALIALRRLKKNSARTN